MRSLAAPMARLHPTVQLADRIRAEDAGEGKGTTDASEAFPDVGVGETRTLVVRCPEDSPVVSGGVRIEQVGVERAYRIVGMLEENAQMLENEIIPRIGQFIARWHKKIMWLDGIILLALLVAFFVATIWGGYWHGLTLKLPFLENLPGGKYTQLGLLALLVLLFGYVHFSIRRLTANYVSRKLLAEFKNSEWQANYARAFQKNNPYPAFLVQIMEIDLGTRINIVFVS